MRVWLILLTVLLAGCSSSSGPSGDGADDESDDSPIGGSTQSTDSAQPASSESTNGSAELLFRATVPVEVSVGTPEPAHEISPWIMAFGMAVDEFQLEGLTGLYLELEFDGPDVTLGAIWGASPNPPAGMTVHTSLMTWGQTSKTLWVPAADIGTSDWDWYISAGSDGMSPMVTVLAEAKVAITAFYGLELPDDYSNL